MTNGPRLPYGIRSTAPLAVACVAVGLAGTAAAGVDAPLARNKIDQREIEIMNARQPRAVTLLTQGEAALRAGHLEEAAARFQDAQQEAPERALPARRTCQTLSVLGRDAEANQFCTYAMAGVGSALDARASAGAWLSAPRLLTPAELGRATTLSDRAHALAGSEPWGHAADCDIARRLGDRSMLKECVLELSQIAPDHYETLRARTAAAAFSHPWPRRLASGALGLLCLVTLVRMAWLRLPSRSSARVAKAGGLLVLLVLAASSTWVLPARAAPTETSSTGEADLDAPERPLGQLSTKFPVDLNNPSAGIPSVAERNRDPIQFGYWLMDLSVLADRALKKDDYAGAAKYFEALVAAVPDRAIGHSKLCRAYLGMNARDRALVPCKIALAFEGATVEDHLRYARLLISMPGKLAPQAISDIDAQVKHLQEGKFEAPANRIACELAVRLDDEPRLAACTAGLAKAAPDELGTISFEWALALKKGNYGDAERLIGRAQALGMTSEGIEKMQAATENVKPLWRTALANWRYMLGALLLLFAGIVVFVTWRRTSAESKEQPA